MKNITVSVPDDVYRAARISAAQRGTSVSALVRRYLEDLEPGASGAGGHDAGLVALLDEVGERHPGFRMSENLPREELHDRELTRRRHQRDAVR